MSTRLVLPWCRCPTIAIFRIESGTLVRLSRKLESRRELCEMLVSLEGVPIQANSKLNSLLVECCPRHVLLLCSERSFLQRRNDGLREWLCILFLHKSLDVVPVHLAR